MSRRTRVFQIGFNKCGTSSLHNFFLGNGIPSVHWQSGELAVRIHARMRQGEDPVLDYPGITAFTDMIHLTHQVLIEPYKAIDIFYRWHPDAYYVLNTRNCSDWVESRVRHGMVARYQSVFALPDEAAVRRHWIREWYEHHARILGFFASRPGRLLVYDLDRDQPEKLAGFLPADWNLDPALFGHDNRTARPDCREAGV